MARVKYDEDATFYGKEKDTRNILKGLYGLISKKYTSPFERLFESETEPITNYFGGEEETSNLWKGLKGLVSSSYTSPFERWAERQGISRHGDPFGIPKQGISAIGNLFKSKPIAPDADVRGGEEYTTNLLKRVIAPFTSKYTSPEELWAEKQGISRQGSLAGMPAQGLAAIGQMLRSKPPKDVPAEDIVGGEEYTTNIFKRALAPFSGRYTSPEELWAEKQGLTQQGEKFGALAQAGKALKNLFSIDKEGAKPGEEKKPKNVVQFLMSPFSTKYSTGIERKLEEKGITRQGELGGLFKGKVGGVPKTAIAGGLALLAMPQLALPALLGYGGAKWLQKKQEELEDKDTETESMKKTAKAEEERMDKEIEEEDRIENKLKKVAAGDTDALVKDEEDDFEEDTIDDMETEEESRITPLKQAAAMTVANMQRAGRPQIPLTNVEGFPGVPARQPTGYGLQGIVSQMARPRMAPPTTAPYQPPVAAGGGGWLKKGLGTLFDIAQLYAGALPQRVPTPTTMPAPIETRRMREREAENRRLALEQRDFERAPNKTLSEIMGGKLPAELSDLGSLTPAQLQKVAPGTLTDILTGRTAAKFKAIEAKNEAKAQDIAVKLKGIELKKDDIDWGRVNNMIDAQGKTIYGTPEYMAYGREIMNTLGVQVPPDITPEEEPSWIAKILSGISGIGGSKKGATKYKKGQIIIGADGKKYEILADGNNPDVKPVQ